MTNRTDWNECADDIIDATLRSDPSGRFAITTGELNNLRNRISVELHNAFVAGQESVDRAHTTMIGDPEWAAHSGDEIHDNSCPRNRLRTRNISPDVQCICGNADGHRTVIDD